jgi:hypothetical protein
MENNRKHLIDRFQVHLGERYGAWCERHGLQKSDEHLVTFIIDQDLIPFAQLQRFAVSNEFENLNQAAGYHKTQSVTTLAHRFNISERTVWSILKHGGTGNGKQH